MKRQVSLIAVMLIFVLALASCSVVHSVIGLHTVTFDLNGGVGGEDFSESINVFDGKTAKLPTPTKEDYTFDGWFNGEELFTEESPVTSDLTLMAKWHPNKVKVSFMDYFGNLITEETVDYGSGAIAPSVDAVIGNQKFVEWDKDFSCVTEDITVKAVYGDNVYTISYNCGEIAESFTKTCFIGELPNFPEIPEVEGHVFFGWYTDAELTDRYFFDYKLDRDITLYAKFYDTSLGEYIVISNVDQLAAIKDQPDAKYLLACDINCKGEKLTPINFFSGELDGNGYKVHNLIISETSLYAGLIGTIASTGTVKNLNVSDYTYDVNSSYVQGSAYYGIIAALNYGLIENCHVTEGEINVVSSTTKEVAIEVGGIVGRNGNYGNYIGHIVNCTNRATINAHVTHTDNSSVPISVGGIVGRNYDPSSEIINCTNYGSVNLKVTLGACGTKHVATGGICGYNGYKIDGCVNNGNISTTVELRGTAGDYITYTGGIVGENHGDVNNSYSSGNVIKTQLYEDNNYIYETYDHIGGFAGWNCGKIYNCYSTGDVSAMPSQELYISGFVGLNAKVTGSVSTITKCFSTGNCEIEIVGDIENSASSIFVGYFAGRNDVNIKDCYYLDSIALTYKNIAGESELSEEIEATCTEGEAKTLDELTSVDFIENTLYFDRMIWFVYEGKLPTLR